MDEVSAKVLTPGRTCGTCAACCTTAEVRDLRKPAGMRCPNVRMLPGSLKSCGSCGTYKERPAACATFRCSWLEGYGPESHRPDRVGAVVEFLFHNDEPFVAVVVAGPDHQTHSKSVRDLVRAWNRAGLAVISGRTLVATPSQKLMLSNCAIKFSDGPVVRIKPQ